MGGRPQTSTEGQITRKWGYVRVDGYTLTTRGSGAPPVLFRFIKPRYTVKKYTIDPKGQVTKNRKNQNTFTPIDERSANAQNIAMPKETISAHGIVRTSNDANRIPKVLLADEEFKKFRTHGTANEK
jgi:hypothetical protein